MSRRTFSDRIGKGIGVSLALGAAALLVSEGPGLVRYLNILRMARRRRDGSNIEPNGNEASYAQGPRRSGEMDEDKGKERREGPEDASAPPVITARTDRREARSVPEESAVRSHH